MSTRPLPEKVGSLPNVSEEVWELGDALMEYHLKQKDLLGDEEEMNFQEMAEISGVPVHAIMQVYESAISKCRDQWMTTK